MYERLTEEEIEFMENFYSPDVMIECLIPENINNPNEWKNEDCKLITLRPYQFFMIAGDSLYANDFGKTEKENFKIKKGAGDIINIAARNIGKCSWIEDECKLANGSNVRFGDLINQQAIVLSYNEKTMQLEEDLATFSDNGVKPCYKIKLKSGKEITVTENHPLLTGDGWVEAKNIKKGHSVATLDNNSFDISYENVINSSFVGVLQTVAVEVKKNHNYISNNIISHNTAIGLVPDAILRIIYDDGAESCISSFDQKHLEAIAEKVANVVENHKFFEMYALTGQKKTVARNPHSIRTKTGHLQVGVNEQTKGKNPGTDFHGLHYKSLNIDEASYMSNEGTKKRVDSGSSIGYIERYFGIPEIVVGRPLGDMLRDPEKKNFICRVPQSVRPDWDEDQKKKMVKEYQGEHCFDEHTEVLTSSGWKKWFNISNYDKVLSLDLNTNYANYCDIKNIYVYNYNKELYYYKNSYVDLALTGNHSIIYNTIKNNKNRTIKLEEIFSNIPKRRKIPLGVYEHCLMCDKNLDKKKKQKKFCSRSCQMKYSTWDFYPINKFKIPASFKWKGKTLKKINFDKASCNSYNYNFKMDDWLEFLGWFVSEGWVSRNKRKLKSGKIYYSNEIKISQTKTKYLKEIEDCLKRLGVSSNYIKSTTCFTFNSKSIAEYLLENVLHLARNKRVPDFIKYLSPRQINIFLDAFNKGDGDGKRNKYYTSSYQLANDLQELIFKSGNASSIYKSSKLMYEVYEHKNFDLELYKKKFEKRHYNGKVWCVETEPNHTIFIRRNGKCCWTGNSNGYKINVLADLIDGGEGKYDIERIKKNCWNFEKRIKFFELEKEIFHEIENLEGNEKKQALNEILSKKLIIERLPSDKIIVASDIGTSASPSEIIICFGLNTKWKYEYQISLFKMTVKEQAQIFSWLYEKLGGCFISLDCNSSEGKSIRDELIVDYNIPQDILSNFGSNNNIDVDFIKDEKGKLQRDRSGKPLVRTERTLDWGIAQLERILYEGLIEIPHDEKFLKEFSQYWEIKTGNRTRHGSSTTDHLHDSFVLFALCAWENEFGINKIRKASKRCLGYI